MAKAALQQPPEARNMIEIAGLAFLAMLGMMALIREYGFKNSLHSVFQHILQSYNTDGNRASLGWPRNYQLMNVSFQHSLCGFSQRDMIGNV